MISNKKNFDRNFHKFEKFLITIFLCKRKIKIIIKKKKQLSNYIINKKK